MVLHLYFVKRIAEAITHLSGRKLSTFFPAFVCTSALKVAVLGLARVLCCAEIKAADPEPPRGEKKELLQFAWVGPLTIHLVLRFLAPSGMRRVRRAVAELGIDKQTRGLAAMAHIVAGGPCGSDWRGIARDAASHFRAIPSAALRSSHLGSGPLSAPDARLLEGARLAPAFGEVDAFISYTVSLDYTALPPLE